MAVGCRAGFPQRRAEGSPGVISLDSPSLDLEELGHFPINTFCINGPQNRDIGAIPPPFCMKLRCASFWDTKHNVCCGSKNNFTGKPVANLIEFKSNFQTPIPLQLQLQIRSKSNWKSKSNCKSNGNPIKSYGNPS